MTEDPGFLEGRHFTDWVDDVRELRRNGDDDSALELLERLMAAVEAERAVTGHPIPSWYYEQAAIIFRKRKDVPSEMNVLERFAAATPKGRQVQPAMAA